MQTLQPHLVSESAPLISGWRHTGRLAAILVLVALPIRIYLAITAGMISRDGATFIWYAQALRADPIHALGSHDQHPLYSALVLGMHALLGPAPRLWPQSQWLSDAVLGWQTAAMLVTLIGGLAVVVAVYALARALFDARIGLWAALLTALAAEFCQLSADALSDMPHLALYLFALACAVAAFRHARAAWWLGAGLLSGLAFLARPEGAEVAVAGALTLCTARGWQWVFRIRSLALLCVGAMLMAGPYMLVTGRLVRKKPLTEFVSGVEIAFPRTAAAQRGAIFPLPSSRPHPAVQDGPPASPAGEPARAAMAPPVRAVLMIGERYAQSLRVMLLLPAIAWLVFRRKGAAGAKGTEDGTRFRRAANQMLITIVLMHAAIVSQLLFRFDYWDRLSMRHVLVLSALTLPFAAAGLRLLLAEMVVRRLRFAPAIALLVLIGPTLPWMLERRNVQDVYLRRAGEWIRAQQPSGARIMTTRNMVPFYANGVHVWSPPDHELERILTEARGRRPDYLVFDAQRALKRKPDFFDELGRAARPAEAIERVHTEAQRNRDKHDAAVVYRFGPAPAGS